MNPRCINGGDFLTSCATIPFPKTLLHGVNNLIMHYLLTSTVCKPTATYNNLEDKYTMISESTAYTIMSSKM
jgi:hypothetical protein